MLPTDWLSLASVPLLVELKKVPQKSQWQSYRWALADIHSAEAAPVCEYAQAITLDVYRDECEGYYLNLTAGQPCIFAVLRKNEDDESLMPHVQFVTLSYNEAGRRMDAGEWVEQVPMPEPFKPWLAEFVEANYTVEPKKRRRPQSFKRPEDRG